MVTYMNYDGCEAYCGYQEEFWNDDGCDWDQEEDCEDSWREAWEERYDYEPDSVTYEDAEAFAFKDFDTVYDDQDDHNRITDMLNEAYYMFAGEDYLLQKHEWM